MDNGYTQRAVTSFQHVYVTAHGSWASGPWVGEAAQFGLRLCIADAISSPALGSIFTPSGNGDAVTDQGTSAGTHGTLTKTWDGRIGPLGSTLPSPVPLGTPWPPQPLAPSFCGATQPGS